MDWATTWTVSSGTQQVRSLVITSLHVFPSIGIKSPAPGLSTRNAAELRQTSARRLGRVTIFRQMTVYGRKHCSRSPPPSVRSMRRWTQDCIGSNMDWKPGGVSDDVED